LLKRKSFGVAEYKNAVPIEPMYSLAAESANKNGESRPEVLARTEFAPESRSTPVPFGILAEISPEPPNPRSVVPGLAGANNNWDSLVD